MESWGVGALEAGNAVDAEEAFQEALAHDAGSVRGALGLWALCDRLGRTEEAGALPEARAALLGEGRPEGLRAPEGRHGQPRREDRPSPSPRTRTEDAGEQFRQLGSSLRRPDRLGSFSRTQRTRHHHAHPPLPASSPSHSPSPCRAETRASPASRSASGRGRTASSSPPGQERGQQTCYICEQHEGNKPAAVVFARTPSDPLGKLLGKLDAAGTRTRTAATRSG